MEFNQHTKGEWCLIMSSNEEDRFSTLSDIAGADAYTINTCTMIWFCVFLSVKGQQMVSDNNFIFEIGLLSIVRKTIILIPDIVVSRIVGHVVQHEALIAMADNKNLLLRTAVVRVSEDVILN